MAKIAPQPSTPPSHENGHITLLPAEEIHQAKAEEMQAEAEEVQEIPAEIQANILF
ncbi:MAG: hypothetical protein HC913_01960 [Microscillaceae bacterium]|nr:hypothetical protein [Microscillaceae bacterium]